ncbi:uncharacterized protein J8A68_001527 [[Candida] subhashii]|uniref:VPS37 C-terminal domain-containing protein n=1 Tax=[Candida] subhashii TaxID=561895 RepID=A0A8J5QHW3_9ASCO|nr:uncharacterized protein J8A68_001527 [[Candida] subhashii]KAG7664941.1 hypothetical protein J8A68_001527 [[Candida] subhashii]
MTDITITPTKIEDINHHINKLSINELKPLPLPKNLELLPNRSFEEFVNDKELVQGYVKQLDTYKKEQEELLKQLSTIDHLLSNEISQLIKNYKEVTNKILQQIQSIQIIYQEFLNLETYQYQMLSSNYNQQTLKNKFKLLIEQNNQESLQLIKQLETSSKPELNESEFAQFIDDFRSSRKEYHYRKEKLNRWNEERVSGFL